MPRIVERLFYLRRALDRIEELRSAGVTLSRELWPRLAQQRVRGTLGLLRPLPWLLALGWLGRAPLTSQQAIAERDLQRAVSQALATRGLVADAREVFWLERSPGLLGSLVLAPRALVRARRAEELSDIHLVETRVSPQRTLLELRGVYNLTDTSAVDERQLTVGAGQAAWIVVGGGRALSVHYADLHGEPDPSGPEWSTLARWQNRLINLEDTGQLEGILRRTFKLEPPAERVTLSFSSDALLIDADNHRIRIPTDRASPIEGARHAQEQTQEKSRPGNLVTWAVDRVRALPWFGSDRMQLVKAVAFAGLDVVDRVVGRVTGDDGSTEIAQQLGDLADAPAISYTDPETGWPPPPVAPLLGHPLQGEGQWHALDNDPFILTNPGAPAPFVTSFIRTDPERAYQQTFVVMWDPRQVALHAMSGTVEPKSATGETGPGLVPRKPEVMSRLLAGLNGGFQATHGEFGMMADGIVYLPPKPYAATVAELSDGSTGFGTWPRDENVPDNIVSFRQNMTPLVMDGNVNPYKRTWWGGVPPGWTDESRTVRSAICMTQEGFVAYLYGASLDAERLAMAMQRVRCAYGIHLDMNAGHTGLEFYRSAPEAELPKLERALDGRWETEGPVSGMEGWRFRGRRMMRFMGLMNFPRYIGRESRDFFYLTLRHLLPPRELAPRIKDDASDEGQWKVKGLPHHGWPYALATNWLRPDATRPDTKVRLLALDPRMVEAPDSPDSPAPTVVIFPDLEPQGTASLWLAAHRFVLATEAPHSKARPLATGSLSKSVPSHRVTAAVGLDPHGMLIYAEIANTPDPGRDGPMLQKLLAELGCGDLLWLNDPVDLALGGELGLSGRPWPPGHGGIRLVRTKPPGAVRIFTDTPIVPLIEWYPLQSKRVRYLSKPKPRTEDKTDVLAPASSAAETSRPASSPPGDREPTAERARTQGSE